MTGALPDDTGWIDQAADRFEQAWRAGQHPRIEDYLAEIPEPGRPLLLEELLRVERELRERSGEQPNSEEYRNRFPERRDAVNAIFGPACKSQDSTHAPDATLSYSVAREAGKVEPLLAEQGLEQIASRFSAGTVLEERYVLERELGRGGMGVVFLGRDSRLDRPVAIKAILPSDSGSLARGAATERDLRDRFIEEARIGANLVHPAIATVHDFGLEGHVPFTVFEFIPGETLGTLLRRRGRLPLEEALLILEPLAQGLDFAHSRHVVHRDLKPENIKATEQGHFKILDLGLATEFRRHVDWRFCGTPAYASPEQAAGLACDGRTDQYALAVIAYEMLTGHRPFKCRDAYELLEMHRSKEPPLPQDREAGLPHSVCSALLRGLEKDPDRRFKTCEEFAVALGCQLLSAPATEPEILSEADVCLSEHWYATFFERTGPTGNTHLVLEPDSLWSCYRNELMRCPLRAITSVERPPSSKMLYIRFESATGIDRRSFRFATRDECSRWHDQLRTLKEKRLIRK